MVAAETLMTLSDLASLGSFVSGVAVVATLGFLVVQMRQANRNQRSLIQQARSDRNMGALRDIGSPHVSAAIQRFDDDKDFTSAEANAYIRAIWSVEDSYLQFQAGTLDAESWESDQGTIRAMVRDPSVRAVWRIVRNFSSGSYQRFIDEAIREAEPIRSLNLAELWKKILEQERAKAKTVSVEDWLKLNP
jgi:hypothetical protein